MKKSSENLDCPCGGGRFDACCGRFLDRSRGLMPDTAEALMRSRYTAYVRRDEDWLRETWHPDTRPQEPVTEDGVTWLGLEVRRHDIQDDDHALVEFVARCRIGGRGQRLHEVSRFTRDAQGRWRYVDGSFPDRTP